MVDDIIYHSTKVKEGEKVTVPTNPTKEGYTFQGWYTDYELTSKFDVNSVVKGGNLVLYAKFTEQGTSSQPSNVYYYVRFYVDGVMYGEQKLAENSEFRFPTNPIKNGYEFKGWLYNGNIITSTFKVTCDMVLEAQFEEVNSSQNYCTVEIKVNGKVVETINVLENSSFILPEEPKLDGYKFIGWYCNGIIVHDSIIVTGNVTIEAQFEEIEKHIHDFTYNIETVESTCVTEGYIKKYCSCGESEESITARLDHNYDNEHVCVDCGYAYYTEGMQFTLLEDDTYVVMLYDGEHTEVVVPKYYNGKLVTGIGVPGIDAPSVMIIILPDTITYIAPYAFYNCHNLMGIYYYGSQEEWNNIDISPDGNDKLLNVYIDYNYLYNHSHEFNSEIVEPTCEEEGYTLYTCKCGESYKDNYVNALGHDLYTSKEYSHYYHYDRTLCNRCNYMESSEPVEHNYQCEVIKEATCEEDGLEIIYCDSCDYQQEHPLLSFGHIIVTTPRVESTCQINGWTEGSYCDTCGEVFAAPETLPLAEHTYNEDKLCIVCGYEYYTEGLQFEFDYTEDGYVVTGYVGSDLEIIIPNYIDNKPVISIKESAFANLMIESVIMSNTVKSIGYGVFYNCSNLSKVVFSETLEIIYAAAFNNCVNLKEIELPNSLMYICEGCFMGCSGLVNVNIPNSVKNIAYFAFSNCTSLENVKLSSNLVLIDSNTFDGCTKLMNLVIPESVQEIRSGAFAGCTNLVVYAEHTKEEWDQISEYNNDLSNANIYYLSDTQPTTEGNYWHYVNGVVSYVANIITNPGFEVYQTNSGNNKFVELKEGATFVNTGGIFLPKLISGTDYIESYEFDAVTSAKVEMLAGTNTTNFAQIFKVEALDINGNVVEEIEIASIELPVGDGSEIGNGDTIEGVPVELSIKCASSADLSKLDKIMFQLDVASGNGEKALSGLQGLQICDIVLQIMCDFEMELSK